MVIQEVLLAQTGLVRDSISLVNFFRQKFGIQSILPDVALICQIFHDYQLRAISSIFIAKKTVYQF